MGILCFLHVYVVLLPLSSVVVVRLEGVVAEKSDLLLLA